MSGFGIRHLCPLAPCDGERLSQGHDIRGACLEEGVVHDRVASPCCRVTQGLAYSLSSSS
eukprot:107062-Pelagomonas_calceolata.AAC.2